MIRLPGRFRWFGSSEKGPAALCTRGLHRSRHWGPVEGAVASAHWRGLLHRGIAIGLMLQCSMAFIFTSNSNIVANLRSC